MKRKRPNVFSLNFKLQSFHQKRKERKITTTRTTTTTKKDKKQKKQQKTDKKRRREKRKIPTINQNNTLTSKDDQSYELVVQV